MERFWSKVDKSGDCWMWTAGCTGSGYGAFHVTKEALVLAHRYAYETEVGPIPEGKVIDHECHNDTTCPGGVTCPHRKCVKPAHLKPKTNTQNLEAGPNWNRKKTHCPRNHEYTEANTITQVKANGGIARRCRQCARERDRTPERVQAHRIYKQKASK